MPLALLIREPNPSNDKFLRYPLLAKVFAIILAQISTDTYTPTGIFFDILEKVMINHPVFTPKRGHNL